MKTTTYGEIKVGKKKLIGSDYSEEELNKILEPQLECVMCGKAYNADHIRLIGGNRTCSFCVETN
jgi:hypothetical protein